MEYGLREMLYISQTLSNIVLILVLMEYGLRVLDEVRLNAVGKFVLILVLMEYGLRVSGYPYFSPDVFKS